MVLDGNATTEVTALIVGIALVLKVIQVRKKNELAARSLSIKKVQDFFLFEEKKLRIEMVHVPFFSYRTSL